MRAAAPVARRAPGLRVVDSPACAVFLCDQGRLDYVEATAALARSQAARHVSREALILLAELAGRKEATR